MNFYIKRSEDYLVHHGILGMKWGQRNGPPYPLDSEDHSSSEKKAGWRKSLGEKYTNAMDRKAEKRQKQADEAKLFRKVKQDRADRAKQEADQARNIVNKSSNKKKLDPSTKKKIAIGVGAGLVAAVVATDIVTKGGVRRTGKNAIDKVFKLTEKENAFKNTRDSSSTKKAIDAFDSYIKSHPVNKERARVTTFETPDIYKDGISALEDAMDILIKNADALKQPTYSNAQKIPEELDRAIKRASRASYPWYH